MKNVTGLDKMLQRLAATGRSVVPVVVEALEKTAVDVANHAKAGHDSAAAHANQRYRNRTTTLTRSIIPSDAVVAGNKVTIEVFSDPDIIATHPEAAVRGMVYYGPYVEQRYPFLAPALQASKTAYRKRLTEAVRRAIK